MFANQADLEASCASARRKHNLPDAPIFPAPASPVRAQGRAAGTLLTRILAHSTKVAKYAHVERLALNRAFMDRTTYATTAIRTRPSQ